MRRVGSRDKPYKNFFHSGNSNFWFINSGKYPEKLNADDSLTKILQSLRKELFMAKNLRDLIILEMTVNSNTDRIKLCSDLLIITEFYSITHDIQTSIK